jgi:GABA(A) receptor-associated protein
MTDKFISVYQAEHERDARIKQYKKLMVAHPGRIPVIIEKAKNTATPQPDIKQSRYLFPADTTVSNIYCIVRKFLSHIKPNESFYLFTDNILLNSADTLDTVYTKHKDDDGFLYIYYSVEDTFG